MKLLSTLVLLVVCQTALAATVSTAPTPPCRATLEELTIKKPWNDFYYWYRGRVATQVQRDCMQQTLTAIAVPEALRYARTIPGCANKVEFGLGQLSKITAKLGTTYEQMTLLPIPGSAWVIQDDGRNYSDEQSALKDIQYCSITSGSRNACAASPLMTTQLQRLLDLKIISVNGVPRCERGAPFNITYGIVTEATSPIPTAPLEPKNNYRALVGPVQSKTLMIPPDLAKLHATHEAHSISSDARCGGPTGNPGAVQNAHLALESTAKDEAAHHFFRMKDFSGFMDPKWTTTEQCKWAQIQDVFHERWMEFVAKGDWGHARQADANHQLAHICGGYKDDRLRVLFCELDDPHDCVETSCSEYLAAF